MQVHWRETQKIMMRCTIGRWCFRPDDSDVLVNLACGSLSGIASSTGYRLMKRDKKAALIRWGQLLHQGDSHAFRGYGNVVARGWYLELPDAVRHIVDQAGCGTFCRELSRLTASRPLLVALVERWWDTTDSFHFSATGDMAMTPFDFSMLTSIGVGGDPIPFDTDMDEWEAAQMYLLGAQPPLARPGFVRYSWFEDHFRIQPSLALEAPMAQDEVEQYARGFLMFLLGTTLFTDRANTVPLCLLSALVDVTRIRLYDWGGAGLATLYGYMNSSSRYSGQLLGGYWRAWEPPFQISVAGGAPAGPYVLVRGGGRGGTVYPCTKVGRTHIGSSSRAPIPDDDESEAESEAEVESSEEETGDDSGSGSDGGAGDDAPGPSSRKRTRRDPQA